MSTMLNFRHGLYSGLFNADGSNKLEIKNGTIYVTTDEKAMYVDLNDQRIRLSQIVSLPTITDWQNLTPPYSTQAFYYIIEANALLKYNGTDWVQINSTADLKSQIDTLNTQLYGADGQGGDINSLKTNVTNLRTDVDGLIGENGTIAGINGRLDDLEDQDEVIDGQIKALDKKITDGLAAAGSNETVQGLVTDMTSVKDKLSDGQGGLLDVSDIKSTADAALPKATFDTFKTDNEKAIDDAEKAAKDYADEKVKALAGGQVATNTNSITNIKTALDDGNGNLLDVSEINAKAGTAIQKDGSVAMAANLDVDDHKIINVATPENNKDAANKKYVDDQDKQIAGTNDDGTLYTAHTVKEAYIKAEKGVTDAAAAQQTADSKVDAAYVTSALTPYAKSADVTAEIDADVAAAKEAILGEKDSTKTVAGAYTAAAEAKAEAEKKATIADVEAKGYAIASEVEATYAKKTNVTSEIAGAKSAILGQENGADFNGTVMGAYAAAEAANTKATQAYNLADGKVTMAQVEAKNYITMAQVEAKDYATKAEAQTKADNAAAAVRGETTETVASVNAKAEKNKTDIATLDQKVDDLEDTLVGKMQEADAMQYKGVVANANQPAGNISIGYTYKATAEFSFTNKDDEKVDVYIGDLLIANGVEDDSGFITSGFYWDHVPAGYHADYVPEFTLNDGGDTDKSVTLNLTSSVATSTGDLGKVTFEVDPNCAITLTSTNTADGVGAISIGLAWESF